MADNSPSDLINVKQPEVVSPPKVVQPPGDLLDIIGQQPAQ
jgi:hypothetical protein